MSRIESSVNPRFLESFQENDKDSVKLSYPVFVFIAKYEASLLLHDESSRPVPFVPSPVAAVMAELFPIVQKEKMLEFDGNDPAALLEK